MFTRRAKSFIYGLTLPWTALKLIVSRPALLFWSGIPVIVTLGVYFFFVRWLNAQAREAVSHSLVVAGFNPDGWGATLILILSKLVLFIAVAMTFSVTSSIIASPFNDFLAECAEKSATPPLPPSTITSMGGKARLVGIDILKSLAALVATLLALLLSWVPLLNFFCLIAAFLLITFQYVTYPQTRRGEGIWDGVRFLWKHLWACTGLGATLSVLFAFPIVSSLSLPLAVVAGTLLYARASCAGDSGSRAASTLPQLH